ncbi:MAG: DUF3137 domain-containing protein [Candidatus Altiarchaeota archaeon]|nr:DUF3137 domain-containing protein [Candidatus Altiarchaeota archaeon]
MEDAKYLEGVRELDIGEMKEHMGNARRNLAYVLLICGGLLIISYLLTNFGIISPIWFTILAMGMAIACYAAYRFIGESSAKKYKSYVMPRIAQMLGAEIIFDPKRHVSLDVFLSSKIFLDRVDVFEGEDYFSGKVGETRIEFSEVDAKQRKEVKKSDGNRGYEYVTIFKGVFFLADFNKNFNGTTLVLPDSAESLLGNMLGSFVQSKNFQRPPLAKLEDPEFEKYFVVYSTDQIEARYILSPSMMDRITTFRKKAKVKVYLSFIDNKLMIALPSNKNLFEPGSIVSGFDKKMLDDAANDLSLIIGIVKDLDLNTRIWSKN